LGRHGIWWRWREVFFAGMCDMTGEGAMLRVLAKKARDVGKLVDDE